ncbi:MAG: CYTH domain-containing protein [Chitinophagales bacterium]|nr:CYTH domain-containing protein [Chitinophagales bacterium]
MGKEIERKFLVHHEKWSLTEKPQGENYRQGYLQMDMEKAIRVRQTPDKAFITIKGKSFGFTRSEYEYEIPYQDAEELLDQFAITELKKIRYKINVGDKIWEVDEFLGGNEGLIVAEIELKSEDEDFIRPEWIGKEVTMDDRYLNMNLAMNPYSTWLNV